MYATEKKLQARVISVMKNGAEVELIDNSSSIPMISEILIKKHLAFKEDLLLNPNTLPCELVTSNFQNNVILLLFGMV